MESTVRSLLRDLEKVDYGLPAYNAPVGDSDLAMDSVVRNAIRLAPMALDTLADHLDQTGRRALYRYGVRAVSRSVSTGDVALAETGLLGAVIAEWSETEPRDLMVNFTPHHVAASHLEGNAMRLFDWAASRGSPAPLSRVLRDFGRRTDVTLGGFGWKETPGSDMVWFELEW